MLHTWKALLEIESEGCHCGCIQYIARVYIIDSQRDFRAVDFGHLKDSVQQKTVCTLKYIGDACLRLVSAVIEQIREAFSLSDVTWNCCVENAAMVLRLLCNQN